MPSTQINWDLHNIKPYHDNNILNKFINRSENFFDSYKVYNDTELNKYIFDCTEKILIDKAKAMVGNRVEINKWGTLKTALFHSFSDRRDFDCPIRTSTRRVKVNT